MIDDEHLINPDAGADDSLIVEVTAETFQAQVLDRSQSQVVLVDFWADWCGPCQSLTPILESLVAEFAGSVVLAKVNADQEQALAGHFGIRSLPTVLIVNEGSIVDHFMGVQPESEIREMLSKYAQPGATEELPPPPSGGEVLDVAALRQALIDDPDNDQTKLNLAVALAQSGSIDEAHEQFSAVKEDQRESDHGIAALGQIELWQSLPEDADPAKMRKDLEANSEDVSALLGLGTFALLQGESEMGFDLLLNALKVDRDFADQAPRKALLSAFKMVTDTKLVAASRRRMSSVLF